MESYSNFIFHIRGLAYNKTPVLYPYVELQFCKSVRFYSYSKEKLNRLTSRRDRLPWTDGINLVTESNMLVVN